MKRRRVLGVISMLAMFHAISVADDSPPVELLAETAGGEIVSVAAASRDAISLDIRLDEFRLDDPVIAIRGIENLTELRRIRFIVTPQVESFTFLEVAPWVEEVVIVNSRVDDLGFISKLPMLKSLVVEMCRSSNGGSILGETGDIDLSDNSGLESLKLINCGLLQLPRIDRIPENIRIIDFSYNNIIVASDDISYFEKFGPQTRIILIGNSVDLEVKALFASLLVTE